MKELGPPTNDPRWSKTATCGSCGRRLLVEHHDLYTTFVHDMGGRRNPALAKCFCGHKIEISSGRALEKFGKLPYEVRCKEAHSGCGETTLVDMDDPHCGYCGSQVEIKALQPRRR